MQPWCLGAYQRSDCLPSPLITSTADEAKAFAKIPPAAVKTMLASQAYGLFEAIIRTHIAEGLVTSADVIEASPFKAIEGFMLSTAADGDTISVNNQAWTVAFDSLASNGIIHQIDQVLNPFTGYFGVSNTTSALEATGTEATISDTLETDARLSNLSEVVFIVTPDLLLDRLNLSEPDGNPQVFVAPSNDAFAATPGEARPVLVAPSNAALSSLLLAFGLLHSDAKPADLLRMARSVFRVRLPISTSRLPGLKTAQSF